MICIRPFITFTNRIGQDIHLKLSSEDEPKVLRASDSRVSFLYREMNGSNKLQVNGFFFFFNLGTSGKKCA